MSFLASFISQQLHFLDFFFLVQPFIHVAPILWFDRLFQFRVASVASAMAIDLSAFGSFPLPALVGSSADGAGTPPSLSSATFFDIFCFPRSADGSLFPKNFMASENYVQSSIPHFDGHHYDHWSMLMENFLRSKEYWTIVEVGVPELAAEFEVLQMQIGESVDDYFARTMAIANKMRIHGENLEDVAINSLLIHERKINRQDKQEQAVQTSQTQALQTTVNSRAVGQGKENWKGRPRSGILRSDKLEESSAIGIQKRWQNRNYQVVDNRSKSAGKANIECFRCHNNHMCGDKSAFSDLDESCQDKVKFGDNSTIAVKGRGKDTAWLWHCRFGHLYFGGLKALQQKKMVNGLPHFDSPSEICEICMTKSEALAAFKNFKVLAENEVGRSVKVLRTDRGAYTPQQNGVCERRNHTIMNMVRSLMSKSGLPKEFWPEAVNWSVHILNRSPTSPFPDLTPEEAWSGHRPVVDYFRIFGCIAYAHVPDQKKKKSGQQISADFENGEDLTVQNSEGQTSADLEVSRQTVEEILPTEVEFSIGGSLPTTLELEFGTSSKPQRKKRRPAWLEDYEEVLDRFQMKNCNSVATPVDKGVKLVKDPGGKSVDSKLYKQIVGSLMYLIATRPDIMHGVSLISRYMEHPKELHLQTAKRILRYLCETADFGLFYKKGDQTDLVGFTDSDYARDLDDRKSTSGFVFMLGSGAISWSSKKQPIVTLSTTEVEYVAATSCACQAIWLRRIMEELELNQHEATSIYCDNSSTIKLSKNPVLDGRSKHIHVRYHFLRNLSFKESPKGRAFALCSSLGYFNLAIKLIKMLLPHHELIVSDCFAKFEDMDVAALIHADPELKKVYD
ncbi:hypothetical protein SLEP1_g38828 [Rubroshorea leprosula]|uniref:Integrase catalytic domain-containing protein n=1 Tax=Rubroshorea leprosula TaxID=152421 RepID=A0AAV5KYV4_9ROSI|nr:hypothetical protein SLEP1_g38828 [Rubroshorea leprosula]